MCSWLGRRKIRSKCWERTLKRHNTSQYVTHYVTQYVTKMSGTKVYKKSTSNGKMTVYIGKRDFFDHLDYCDPIDGVVSVDPDSIKPIQKVMCQVKASFRYGREDLDVLGMTFKKDLFIVKKQVYPPIVEEEEPLTNLQERLITKLRKNVYPFKFELPKGTTSSVTLQPTPGETGEPCGVDYELRVYLSDTADDKEYKRNYVRLAIRKITYAPSKPGPHPMIEAQKEFMLRPQPLSVEGSLDKGTYYHGEAISVNVHVTNMSSKSVRRMKVSVLQCAEICLFSTAEYKCPVACVEVEEGFPVAAGGTLSKVIDIIPLLANNKEKRGLALDGQIKHEDTNLASSTIVEGDVQKENLGIIVSYKVKIKLIVAYGGDLSCELPFVLTHPQPPVKSPEPSPSMQRRFSELKARHEDQPPVDSDLINFDIDGTGGAGDHDGLIFEEFARMRVREQHTNNATNNGAANNATNNNATNSK